MFRIDKLGEIMEDESWEMVQKKGNQFVINDQPFYVNGFNTYWLMVFAADQSTRGKVSELFKEASSAGLTVCRTWAFNDGQWRALQKSPSVYDEDVFKVRRIARTFLHFSWCLYSLKTFTYVIITFTLL